MMKYTTVALFVLAAASVCFADVSPMPQSCCSSFVLLGVAGLAVALLAWKAS